MSAPAPMEFIRDDEIFVRMTRTERWQHLLLVASFTVLLATGLPVLFGYGGGHAWRGVLHRLAALALIGDFGWHVIFDFLTERGRRDLRDMRPRGRDLLDVLAHFRLRGPRPEFGRFGVAEKLEYWSFLWGSALMIATGLLMWFPGLSLRSFPLALHQTFIIIHGFEAVLALLAILLWHMYTVHLKPGVFPMSRVWLDGRITGADMKRFHPLEYRRIWEERERLAGELLASEAVRTSSARPGTPDAPANPDRPSSVAGDDSAAAYDGPKGPNETE